MENTERDQPSIDGDTFSSSDVESEKSTDTELPISIDTAKPKAASQTEQETEIPVKGNSTLTKGEDIKLSIQDYLDPGATTVGLRRLENKLNPFAKLARITVDRHNYHSVDRSLQRGIGRCTLSHIDQHSLEIKIRQLRSEIYRT
ncbi:hypothetical protein F2Q68_00033435 [Brassica cretica]|uniref:Uncharacterized protein n=1 Tax=Brassica cretica TaxID=69181 RepID=A0A8S9GU50_BRACR|nr:hypothetical protein F2Q68_00033435 [Brassica cretica]